MIFDQPDLPVINNVCNSGYCTIAASVLVESLAAWKNRKLRLANAGLRSNDLLSFVREKIRQII